MRGTERSQEGKALGVHVVHVQRLAGDLHSTREVCCGGEASHEAINVHVAGDGLQGWQCASRGCLRLRSTTGIFLPREPGELQASQGAHTTSKLIVRPITSFRPDGKRKEQFSFSKFFDV